MPEHEQILKFENTISSCNSVMCVQLPNNANAVNVYTHGF